MHQPQQCRLDHLRELIRPMHRTSHQRDATRSVIVTQIAEIYYDTTQHRRLRRDKRRRHDSRFKAR